jgi:hypothetical protein
MLATFKIDALAVLCNVNMIWRVNVEVHNGKIVQTSCILILYRLKTKRRRDSSNLKRYKIQLVEGARCLVVMIRLDRFEEGKGA